jgi:hypothetical protein
MGQSDNGEGYLPRYLKKEEEKNFKFLKRGIHIEDAIQLLPPKEARAAAVAAAGV